MDNPVFISLVIPVYNEELRIHSFLSSVIRYLLNRDFTWEIVIVDDGSSDETASIVSSTLNQKLPGKYTIVRLPVNSGKGAAVKRGMLEAKGEYIFFIDADGSTSVEEIDRFVDQFTPGTDIYIARRTLKQEAPFKRKFFGYGYILLANFILNLGVSDITCGFKCYTRQCVHTVFPRQTLNNWSFDAEDIFIARKHNFTIGEITVSWKHTFGSKVRVFRNIIVCALDLLRIRFCDLRGRYS